MKSGGFPKVGTCFQSLTLVDYCIRATILTTNIFHLVAGEDVHDKTIAESAHRWTLFISTFNSGKILSISSASNIAPHSSNLGKVTISTGATLEGEYDKWLLTSPRWSTNPR
jgi:hypothetical protein